MTNSIIFENARILDGSSEQGDYDQFVRVDGEKIDEVSDRPIGDNNARRIDLRGKTLMPGLIDCHVHVIAAMLDLGKNANLPDVLVAFHAARIMKDMLHRGFTTVRDLGGASHGLVEAVEQGLIPGPNSSSAAKRCRRQGATRTSEAATTTAIPIIKRGVSARWAACATALTSAGALPATNCVRAQPS